MSRIYSEMLKNAISMWQSGPVTNWADANVSAQSVKQSAINF